MNGNPRWMFVLGWVCTGLAVLAALMPATFEFLHRPEAVQALTTGFGWQERWLSVLPLIVYASLALYLIPQTSVLGAILLTGYMGGAAATHLRVGDIGWFIPTTIGVLAWVGLFLREPRLRQLLPLRKSA